MDTLQYITSISHPSPRRQPPRQVTQPPSPTQQRESAYLGEKDREDIKSVSIIFLWAADSLSQISQSLLCTVYCHRVLTLSCFNWNGERGDYPIYSGAQHFPKCLNTGGGRCTCVFLREQLEFIKNSVKKRNKKKKKYGGKDCGSAILFIWIFTEQELMYKEKDENEKGRSWRFNALALEGLSSAFSP